jgi:lambda family phage tail tape measure protein
MATSPGQAPKVQLDVTANTEDAVKKIGEVGASAERMADKVETVTTKSGRTFERITSGAGQAAAATDRATKTIVGSIQRAQAAEAAGGRDQPDYYLNIAKQRGANIAVIEQEVQKLRQLREANLAANASLGQGVARLNEYGLTAKQTSAALRQVPAQITDIVVSLQGGQAPLTVLLQQGGQLKDVFGGVVPAAKALGSTLLGLVNPLTATVAAAAGLALAYNKGASEIQAFNKTLILSGNTLGLTGLQLQNIARSLGDANNAITQSRAAEVLNQIAASGKIGADNFARFTEAAVRFSDVSGRSIEDVVKNFEELGKAPLQASIKLTEATGYLTVEIYDQIRALEQQGRFIDAARLAQEAYATSLERVTPQLVQNLGYVERAWEGVKNVAAAALSQILEIGRSNPLRDIEIQLQNAYASGATPAEIADLERRYAIIKGTVDLETQRAKTAGEIASRQKAAVDLAEQANKAEGELAEKRRKVAEATDLFARATKGLAQNSAEYRRAELDYLKTVDGILKSQQDKAASRGAAPRRSEADSYLQNLQRQLEAADKLSTVEALTRDLQLGRLGKVTEKQKEELFNVARLIDLDKELVQIEKDFAKLQDEEAKKREKRRLDDVKFFEQRATYEVSFQQQQARYARELSGIGAGSRARSLATGIAQIDDRYGSQREQVATELRRGQITQKEFQRQLDLINEYNQKATDSYIKHYNDIERAQGDWINGANEAINNYQDNAQNVAKATEDVFTSAIQGMEDALVRFVTTGKLSFSELAASIVADITRIIIKEQMSRVLASIGTSILGTTTANILPGNPLDNFLALNNNFAGRANGGPVSPNTIYRVNEQGPELLTVGGNQYLMMGAQSGYVTPNDQLSGGGGTVINVTVPMPQGGSRATAMQFGRDVAQQLQYATMRNG